MAAPEMTEEDLAILRQDAVRFILENTAPDASTPHAAAIMAGLVVLIHRVKCTANRWEGQHRHRPDHAKELRAILEAP